MARIIVADDSRLMRGILRGVLESAGHEVEEWPEVSASEVTERLQTSDADLIVTDYQMPGCNGMTLARLARKARPGLPILVVTATRDPGILDPLRKLGVSRILHKPLHGRALLEDVGALLPRA